MLLQFIAWKNDINVKDLTAMHIHRGQRINFSVEMEFNLFLTCAWLILTHLLSHNVSVYRDHVQRKTIFHYKK